MEQLLAVPEMIYAIYTGIALGVFLFITGIAQFSSRGENAGEARSRRMKMIAAGASTAEILAILKPEQSSSPMSRLPLIGDLPRMLRRAGSTLSAARFLFLCGIFSLLVLAVATYLAGPIMGILFAVLLGIVLPIMVLQSIVKRRDQALTRQLPDALDLLARGLRVGHPLNTSIQAVAGDMPDPIGSEFGIIFDQISYGDDLVDAFQEFSERVDQEDVHYLAASIGIQHGTGGDLAGVIQILSQVVRDRIAMRRRILAISSEGRLSGIFLSLLPVIIFLATSYMSPDYYGGVMDDPMFKPMAALIIFFTSLNFLVIRKLVNFRI